MKPLASVLFDMIGTMLNRLSNLDEAGQHKEILVFQQDADHQGKKKAITAIAAISIQLGIENGQNRQDIGRVCPMEQDIDPTAVESIVNISKRK